MDEKVHVEDEEGCITRNMVQKMCAETEGCYETPELNTKLELQHRGICEIRNLEEYVNVSWLYLQQNGIEVIENIGHMAKLRGLYLNGNEICQLQNLENHKDLKHLSVDENNIESLEGIECCRNLEQFTAKGNAIEDIKPLAECKSLRSLNLVRNKIVNAEETLKILSSLPGLGVLYMKGNPFVSKMKDYRKHVIHTCKKLQFLDDRPVYDWERRFVQAWKKGGNKALDEERKRHNAEKLEKANKELEKWKQAREEMKAKLDAQRKMEETKNYKSKIESPVKLVELLPSEKAEVEKQKREDTRKVEHKRSGKADENKLKVMWKGGVGVREIPDDKGRITKILPYGTEVDVIKMGRFWTKHSLGWSRTFAGEEPVFGRIVMQNPEPKPEPTIRYRRTRRDKQLDPPSECKQKWDNWMDKRLQQECRNCCFDFELVCQRLKTEMQTLGEGDRADELTPAECRHRVLAIDRIQQEKDEFMDGFDPDDLNWDDEEMPWHE
eukprot:CAMPEP_0167819738 /NCGR_PEP_ID=MMETSP0112_2-20121227/5600_1 /TAXON_ID=91324 /ORGANISM="Lotharella globosa, Strain CCCM811" /LENGTH=495 /DNA_ID=CAMNT_0007720013 /DNA_START=41 /DNA_END=1528 /DNA_ORIENTATION=+